mgnify:FL=1
MCPDNVRVELIDMPLTIYGLTTYKFDDCGVFFTIFLNALLSHDKNKQTYDHEMEHIINGDFDKMVLVDMLEEERHMYY